jgi:hypothetical protein
MQRGILFRAGAIMRQSDTFGVKEETEGGEFIMYRVDLHRRVQLACHHEGLSSREAASDLHQPNVLSLKSLRKPS